MRPIEKKAEALLKTSITYFDKYFDRNSFRIAYTLNLIAELEIKNSQSFVGEALCRRLSAIYENKEKDFVYVNFKRQESSLLKRLNRKEEAGRIDEELQSIPEPKPFFAYDVRFFRFVI